jgi:hypothetical protein
VLVSNSALVRKLFCWAIQDVCGKEIGVLGTKSLNETFALHVVGCRNLDYERLT